MRGTMAKAKCEEIIIDQYLKGNIGNDFKDYLLVGFGIPEDEKPFPMNYDVLLKGLEDNAEEFLKTAEKIFTLVLESMLLKIVSKEEVISMFRDKLNELEEAQD